MKFKNDLIAAMKDNIAVHCDTKNKAEALLDELVNQYVRWLTNGEVCSSVFVYDSNWETFESETCYALKEEGEVLTMFGNRESFKRKGYKIIEFEELLEEQVNDNNDYDDLAIKVDEMINNFVISARNKVEAYKDGYVRACEDLREELKNILLNNNTE